MVMITYENAVAEKIMLKHDDCCRQIRQLQIRIKDCNGDFYKKRKWEFHLRQLQNVALPRLREKLRQIEDLECGVKKITVLY